MKEENQYHSDFLDLYMNEIQLFNMNYKIKIIFAKYSKMKNSQNLKLIYWRDLWKPAC